MLADKDREIIRGNEKRCKEFLAKMVKLEHIIPPPLVRDDAWIIPLDAIREEHAELKARGIDPETRFDGVSIEDRARGVGAWLGGVTGGSAGSDHSPRTAVDESFEGDFDSTSSVQQITGSSFTVDSAKIVQAALSTGSSVIPVSASDSCESFKPITRPGTWVPLVREDVPAIFESALTHFQELPERKKVGKEALQK